MVIKVEEESFYGNAVESNCIGVCLCGKQDCSCTDRLCRRKDRHLQTACIAGQSSARTFTLSVTKIALYLILAVSIIGILGVPMASVITIMASAGVAVGLALQGALSNLAGGIMLVIFKPFQIGDFVEAAGISGVINEVSLFYTVFITLDNRRVTVPTAT